MFCKQSALFTPSTTRILFAKFQPKINLLHLSSASLSLSQIKQDQYTGALSVSTHIKSWYEIERFLRVLLVALLCSKAIVKIAWGCCASSWSIRWGGVLKECGILRPDISHQGSSISVESWRVERQSGETEPWEREREREEEGEKVFSLSLTCQLRAADSDGVSRSSDMNNSGDAWPPVQCQSQRNTGSGRRLSCKDERELERCQLKRGGSLRVNLTTDHLSLPAVAKLTDIQVKVDKYL